MQFYYEIPASFWSLFRSVNRDVYIEALLAVNDEYQYNNYFLSREACAEQAGRTLLERAYGGSAGKLVASFIRSGALSPEERAQLKALLDEMEV